MKKLYFLLIVLILFQLSTIDLNAFQNEPKDFRGIPWGTNIKDIPEMTFSSAFKGGEYYVRKNDLLKMRDANIEEITYGFYNGKLQHIFMRFKGYDNYNILKRVLFDNFGSVRRRLEGYEDYDWNGEYVEITFSYTKSDDRGYIIFSYLPLKKEKDGL